MSVLRASSALFISNILALALQLISVRCYGLRLGTDGLADYHVVLAAANVAGPFLVCGLNDALSYLLGRKYAEPRTAQALVLQSALFLGFTATLLALAIAIFPEEFSQLVFETGGKRPLLLATLLFMSSRGLFDLQCRYLLARKQVAVPALGMFLIPGLIPVGVLWVDSTQSLERLLLDASVLSLILMAFSAVVEYRRHANAGVLKLTWDSLRYLFHLGIPRMPTILGMSLLISCQAILARKMHCSAAEQAMIGASMMILRTLAMTQRVVTSVVEPQIGLASVDRPHMIPVLLRALVLLSLGTGIAVMTGLLSVGDTLLQVMGKRPGMLDGEFSRLFWYSALPFTLLFVLRPCVNALSSRAYNTSNMFYSLIGMAGVLGVTHLLSVPPAQAIGYATLLGGVSMAFFSLVTIQHLTRSFERFSFLNVRIVLLLVCSVGLPIAGKVMPVYEDFLSLRSISHAALVGGGILIYLGTVACFTVRTYRLESATVTGTQLHNPIRPVENQEEKDTK
jgi:hypothetical protein